MARSASSRSTTTPPLTPRAAWWPMPSTLTRVSICSPVWVRRPGTTSPIMQQVLVVPISRAATIFGPLSDCLVERSRRARGTTVMITFPTSAQADVVGGIAALNGHRRLVGGQRHEGDPLGEPEVDVAHRPGENAEALLQHVEAVERLRLAGLRQEQPLTGRQMQCPSPVADARSRPHPG